MGEWLVSGTTAEFLVWLQSLGRLAGSYLALFHHPGQREFYLVLLPVISGREHRLGIGLAYVSMLSWVNNVVKHP